MKKIYLSLIIITLFSLTAIPQPASWSSRGVGGGGALFSPSINQGNNNEFYISCDMSELFHTTNFGTTYSQVHFSQFSGGHNSKVCYTSTSNLLYSISYINDIGTPVKSTNNGVNWTTLTGNPDPGSDVYTIHVNYNNSNQIIISTYGEIYISNNGGISFTQFHTATNSGSGNVVAGVLFDGVNIYVGTNDGVLVSTNSGTTWTTAVITGLPSTQRIWSFAAAKVGATTRFFCLTGDAGDIYVGLQGSDYYDFCKGIYSCDYGTTNWTSKITGINLTTDFPMFIDMAENDINTVYVAGSNDNSEPTVFKTTNAGGNWNNTFITTNNQNIITGWSGQGGDRGWSYGECPFGFDVAANSSQVVIFGDFGFCHKTTNGGTSWQQAYVDPTGQHVANVNTPPMQNYSTAGIENTTCWQVHWATANTMWACFSDIKGIRSVDAGNTWSFNYTGNAANSTYRVVQSSTGTLFAGTSNIHDMYQSTRLTDALLDANDVNGKIIYSSNNGQTWQNLKIFNHPVFWIALDPNNANRAYASVIHYNGGAGVGGVYRCDDLSNLATSTWTLLPNPIRTEKHPASLVVLNDGKLVATYSGRRTTGTGAAFTNSSGVFIYDPALNSWADKSHIGMHYWTKDIVVDPNDITQNTWYACVFSGWGGAPNGLGGLYKTNNRGTNWTKLTGSTLDRVTSCTFNPNNVNELYITTETQGLWKSANINNATPAFSNVTSYPFRQPERVFFNPYNNSEMWVTSFGNGMKMGTITTTGEIEFKSLANDELSVFPNPSKGIFNIEVSEKAITSTSFLEVTDIQGRQVLKNQLSHANISIDLSNYNNGVYFLTVKQANTVYAVKKIVLTK
ncbi:MAG: T9SS type A sorting domain-containing protein [Bacteroidota bacterium]